MRTSSTLFGVQPILFPFFQSSGEAVFVELKTYLESILKLDVEFVTKNALHPALKERILDEAKHVF